MIRVRVKKNGQMMRKNLFIEMSADELSRKYIIKSSIK